MLNNLEKKPSRTTVELYGGIVKNFLKTCYSITVPSKRFVQVNCADDSQVKQLITHDVLTKVIEELIGDAFDHNDPSKLPLSRRRDIQDAALLTCLYQSAARGSAIRQL